MSWIILIVGISIIYLIWFGRSKRNVIANNNKLEKKEMKTIDMDAPVQLRFVKTDRWDKYKVQFFNPLCDEWWTLPSLSAGIHKPWSFENKGSYGAYDLYIYTTDTKGIDYIKLEYKTFKDLESYMQKLRKKYTDFQASQKADDERPSVIY